MPDCLVFFLLELMQYLFWLHTGSNIQSFHFSISASLLDFDWDTVVALLSVQCLHIHIIPKFPTLVGYGPNSEPHHISPLHGFELVVCSAGYYSVRPYRPISPTLRVENTASNLQLPNNTRTLSDRASRHRVPSRFIKAWTVKLWCGQSCTATNPCSGRTPLQEITNILELPFPTPTKHLHTPTDRIEMQQLTKHGWAILVSRLSHRSWLIRLVWALSLEEPSSESGQGLASPAHVLGSDTGRENAIHTIHADTSDDLNLSWIPRIRKTLMASS